MRLTFPSTISDRLDSTSAFSYVKMGFWASSAIMWPTFFIVNTRNLHFLIFITNAAPYKQRIIVMVSAHTSWGSAPKTATSSK